MARKGRVRLRRLREELVRAHPSIEDPEATIARGDVVVDGRFVSNPVSLVREGAAIALRGEQPLRGEAKLKAALEAFPVEVAGRTALDVGAAAGGFTRVLLAAGARRVYAVDAGHGQLLGSLRQDARVVELEGVNLGELHRGLVREEIDLVTLDLSYLALARAAPQLEAVRLASATDAIALVKPQFELRLAAPPGDEARLRLAVARAADGFARCGWTVEDVIDSPVRGRGGAREFLLHARRRPGGPRNAGGSGLPLSSPRPPPPGRRAHASRGRMLPWPS